MSIRPSHLAAQVASLRKRLPDTNAFAIHSGTPWDGPAELTVEGTPFLVMNCPSELGMRQVLVEAAASGRPVICVTPLREQDLGADLRARLAKRKVFAFEVWASVLDLFSATHLDPVLLRRKWLADTLLEHYPNPEYEASPNGTLTAKTVWRHVLKNLIGLDGESPDLHDLLRWTLNQPDTNRYAALDQEQQDDIAERIVETAGTAAKYVLECVKVGSPEIALPLALSCEVIYGVPGPLPGELQAAAARLEKYTGGTSIDPESGCKLAHAAFLVCSEMAGRGERKTVDRITQVLDRTLQDVAALGFAHRSSFSPMGFEQMLEVFAKEVSKVLSCEAMPEACWPHILRIREHYQGRLAPDRLERAEMAYRALRWVYHAGSGDQPADLAAAMQRYLDSDSYVDWALTVLSVTESNERLAAAYAELVRKTETLRSAFDAVFARLLSCWEGASAASGTPFGVENLLDRIVTPLAKHGPVLLVVLDGMSCAVFAELMADILQRGQWYELSPSAPLRTATLATVPSTTEVSRLSLLCGRLAKAGEIAEEAGFADHPGLNAASNCRPVLYRKADLLEKGGTQLAAAVRKSIQSPRQRVVGVVINAVDDYLLKGDQLRVSWRMASIIVLESLLQAAQSMGRTVVLTSDHGHVMERGTEYIADDSGGERYRRDNGLPNDRELRVAGKRVLVFDGKLIAPWSSSLRYGPKRNGYHGGLSPREMVVPMAILGAKPEGPEGWDDMVSSVPPWWHLEGAPAPASSRDLHERATENAAAKLVADLPLFCAKQTVAGPDWIGRLLRSDVFRHSQGLCGRAALSEARIGRLLTILAERGYTVMQERLAVDLAEPAFRLPGIISVAQRMLNVDGYTVLSYDQVSGTIVLDKALLHKQFELDE